MLSAIRVDNDKLRIDSGYFAKQMLMADDKIRGYGLGHDELGSIFSRFVKGIFDINAASYVDEGVPFIRIQNLKNGMIDDRGMAFIPEEIHNDERKTELLYGDIVLSKTAYPAASMFTLERGNASQDTIATKLSPYAQSNYKTAAIVAYLNSTFGQTLLWRQFQGNVQLHLSLEDGRKVPIPRFSEKLQSAVEGIYSSAEKLKYAAENSINLADKTLLSTLGLDGWTPPAPLSYVRSSSDVFDALRLDAEHYQPRFSALLSIIDATGAGARLGDHLVENKRGKQPYYTDEGLPVINSKHVLRNDVRIDSDNRVASHAKDDLLIRTGDVLINGTGVGTIGRSAAYLHEESAVPDNHVTILRPNEQLDPIYLAMYLNSIAGQYQVDQRLRGSSGQIELYPNDIAEFRVWLAPKALQQSIRQQVEQSFAEKQKATLLLDAAKRAVEIAIEDSEAAAFAYFQGVI